MVFSSHVFVFYFLPFALLLFFFMHKRGKHLVLTYLSYIFYGWANPLFIFLMLGSTLIDFFCGRYISKTILPTLEIDIPPAKAKFAVCVSIISNLSLLAFFKYFNFAIDSYNSLATSLGMSNARWDTFFRVTLPLGISFYTFQSMSYTIDVYRRKAKAVNNFLNFATYVSMFPQLVAGPIVRFNEIEKQLQWHPVTVEKFARGVAFFTLGLAKKVILANSCGKVADVVFEANSSGVLAAWFGLISYGFQIYYDFSGYSDMAVGLGLMLGFVFPVNFDRPYLAESVTEFWRRWHLSLSRWLRDYLYIPLGGNRLGSKRTLANIAIVMLLGGLWHGAAWNFVFWGGLHCVFLCIERLNNKQSLYANLPRAFRIAVTFLIVNFIWVFFRAKDIGAAWNYFERLFGLTDVSETAGLLSGIIYQPYYIAFFLVAVYVTWGGQDTWHFLMALTWPKSVVIIALFLVSLTFLLVQSYNPFIYFFF